MSESITQTKTQALKSGFFKYKTLLLPLIDTISFSEYQESTKSCNVF
ncbi:MAG: hypothetical protein LBQ24_04630 [Candidatus Peribacteria bacterium]|nr:hypothetical protein [Candidatus Peribacteria bacterium]